MLTRKQETSHLLNQTQFGANSMEEAYIMIDATDGTIITLHIASNDKPRVIFGDCCSEVAGG